MIAIFTIIAAFASGTTALALDNAWVWGRTAQSDRPDGWPGSRALRWSAPGLAVASLFCVA